MVLVKSKGGKLNPNALERMVEIEPLTGLRAKNALLRLDFLLSFMSDKHNDLLIMFVNQLRERFKMFNLKNLVDESMVGKYYEELPMLKKYVDLSISTLDYHIHLLGAEDANKWNNGKIEVPQKNYFRSFLLPTYMIIEVLIDTMGRDRAIEFFKFYLTSYIQSRRPEENNFVDMETVYQKAINPSNPESEWVIIRGLLSKAKYFYRNGNCMWIDALEDLHDSEIKYLTCCYGDYEGARSHYHEAVILTMEHTIAQSDPYCSRVLHDTRMDYDLRHPKKEFWDKLDENDI